MSSADFVRYAQAFARGIRFNAERRRLESALSRHKIRVDQLKKERDEFSLKLEESEERVEQLKKEQDELSSQLAGAKEKAAQAEEKAEHLRKEKDELSSQLARAEEKAAKAEERGERRGRRRATAEARDFLRKALLLVATDFSEDEYFEAFVKYVEERERVIAVGGNPDAVEFPYAVPDTPQGENPLEATAEDDVPSTSAAGATDNMPPPP